MDYILRGFSGVMIMNIVDIILLKFPGVDMVRDVKFQDDGEGVYIKEWNLADAIPTDKQLKKWANDLDLTYRQNKARKERKYPTIEEQLDMLYHDKMEGTNTWAEAIAEVKLNNPIPEA
jgi:hypothetical protein